MIDILLIASQLARQSADSYPFLSRANVLPCALDIAAAAAAAGDDGSGATAKACNLVGNLCRHNAHFHEDMRRLGAVQILARSCASSDPAARRFAAFALGNAAFHGDTLYAEFAA
jgi:fused-like protein